MENRPRSKLISKNKETVTFRYICEEKELDIKIGAALVKFVQLKCCARWWWEQWAHSYVPKVVLNSNSYLL